MSGRLLLCIGVLLLLSACNSLYVRVPQSRMDSPEVISSGGDANPNFHLLTGLTASRSIRVVSDASSRPPTYGTPESVPESEVHIRGGIDYKRVEINLRSGVFASAVPWGVQVKYQFIGDGQNTAKKSNFSLAATLMYASGESKISGDQNGLLGPGGYKWNAKATNTTTDYAIIAGYRVSDELLIYGGPFSAKYSMSGNIHDDLSDNGTSAAADYSLSASGAQSGFNLAAQLNLGTKGYLILEGVYSSLTWTNLKDVSEFRSGALVGFYF